MSDEKKHRPDNTSAAYDRMQPAWTVMRDLSKGTAHMREQKTAYLPQHAVESNGRYRTRLAKAVLFNAVNRTVEGMVGMVFRRNPVPADVPASILAHLENIDNAGTHIDVFARDVLEDALLVGHGAILVDAPSVPDSGRPLTQAEESALGVRPYWVHFKAEDIIAVRSDVVAGRKVLSQVVLREMGMEPDGEFGEIEMTRYRVLWRDSEAGAPIVRWQIWEKTDDDKLVPTQEGVVKNQTEIPLVPVYGKRVGFFESQPPLIDLAYTNIQHYQLTAEDGHAMSLANVAVGVLKGVEDEATVTVGHDTFLRLPADGDFKWETAGGPFEQNRAKLDALKSDMAALGLSMLQVETRAAETAEAKRMDKSEQDSALASSARSLQDALEQCLIFHGRFMRVDNPGTVQVNRDFENLSLTAQQVQVFSQMEAAGQISLDTLWGILAEGGALPDDFDSAIESDKVGGLV